MNWIAKAKNNASIKVVPFPTAGSVGSTNKMATPNGPQESLASIFLKSLPSEYLEILRDVSGQYFTFNGKHWEPISEDVVRQSIYCHPVITGQPHKNPVTATNQIKHELDLLCLRPDFGKSETDTDFSVMNCANGELWIATDGSVTLKPHHPQSWQLGCLPFNYDETATCHMFVDALLAIFAKSSKPSEMIRHLFEIIGYCLQSRRNIAMWVFFIGKGRNGKSKLLETVSRLAGPDAAVNMSLDHFQKSPFNVIALRGKKLFIDDDMKGNTVLDDGLLKRISEGKAMTTCAAYGKHHVNFTSRVVPMLASNHYPISLDSSDGFRRRLNVIPFDRVFTPQEDDKQLFPKIWESELPGILNEAVKGYKRLCQRGGFELPADCIKAAKTFMVYSNPLEEFVEEGCGKDANGSIVLKTFRTAMNDWAKSEGHNIKAPGNKLKSSLENMGFEVIQVNGYPKVKGLALKSNFVDISDSE